MAEGSAVQLPQWQGHKKVWGDKIIGVAENDSEIGWALASGGHVRVFNALKVRGGPEPLGGYYVRYEDGFESWSPAKAFEEGYTLIQGDQNEKPSETPERYHLTMPPFEWMKLWLRAYAEHHEGFDADEVMNWILQQPMTTA